MVKTKPSTQEISPQEKVGSLIKKPETIVGAIVLGAVLVVASQAWGEDLKKINPTVEANLQQPAEKATPTATPEVTATAETTEPLADIQVLANTSASQIVTAESNDTFWKIARRYCGTGVQGYRIEEENGYTYKLLQPGDQIEVTCE